VSELRLSGEAASYIRNQIERAGGREVCFLARVDRVDEDRIVEEPRAVSRGNYDAVLAAARDAEQGGVMLHNHPSGLLEPSRADMAVASRLYDVGLGTVIIDNEAHHLYVVVEPPEPRVVEPLEPAILDRVVAPDGPLSSLHPAYEDRPGQREMLSLVADRYNKGGALVVEAGTGTGKSLAYLLPAAAWALKNGERTVVSTNTINLQEQLVAQDLPLLRRLLGRSGALAGGEPEPEDGEEELSWALVKGRGNYVSIRRARLAYQQATSLFEEDRDDELQGVMDWIDSTEDGSLSDLGFVPSSEVWEEVRSDSDICLRARCPHFQECFYQRSRRRAASADLVVVNHHLLFTDVAVRRATRNFSDSAVLPAYRHLILDEAHNVEDAATSHLGVELTRVGLFRTLSRLGKNGRGVLAAIDDSLRGSPDRGTATELRSRMEGRVRPALEEAVSSAGRFFDALDPRVPEREGEAARLGGTDTSGHSGGRTAVAADGAGHGSHDGSAEEPADDLGIREPLDGLLGSLSSLEREVAELQRRIELDESWADALEGRLLDLQSVQRRLSGAVRALRLVLLPDDDTRRGYVRWLERRRSGKKGRGNPVLAAAPVELGPLLREGLFEPTDTAVLSSATLTTKEGFSFFRERLGLSEEGLAEEGHPFDVEEAVVPSPFDFASQTVLGVPTDLADAAADRSSLDHATAGVVADLAEITDGGVFVLFTSHRSLNVVARGLRDRRIDARFPLFVHGEESRARLLRGFVGSGRGILLGTASFWEGVDVPGRPLRALVLQKLPFRVPTEPVTAARLEAVEEAGGNPFWHYMLPLAALRLKQGFGRLVRSRTDRGAVLLLDDRILRKRYGRYLRDSLPDAPLIKGPWPRVAGRIAEFYEG